MARSTESVEQNFDHNAPDFTETMRDRLADLRQKCPVMHSTAHDGFWVLSKHEDIVTALRDPGTYSSAKGIFIPRPVGQAVYGLPTESDEPDHSHYRRPLWKFLTPAAVRLYEPLVRRTVTELINEIIESGKADALEDLAKPLPAQITGQFFGYTAAEGRRIFELISTLTAESFGDKDQAREAATELLALFQRSLDEARKNPGDDVSSAIVTYDVDGRTFSDQECLGLLRSSIGGALATTVAAIGYAVYLLWKYPEQRRLLVEDPDLSSSAVEEILRMESPVYAVGRTVLQETEVDGLVIEPNERALLVYDSANYDPDAFDEPEEFRIDRPNNTHLAFGMGIHRCLGQHLARLEIRVVIEELVRRIPEYRVVGEPKFSAVAGVLTPVDLHIEFEPGERVPLPEA
ncbi:cytochrome P450 [Pseudonocardia ailaonensis]|uniref:Cytochrome P450 n=1 Tax=Pseudonocardia ailaonensis TaxID=367279 RepID=A0ABN2NJH7_9PSEU